MFAHHSTCSQVVKRSIIQGIIQSIIWSIIQSIIRKAALWMRTQQCDSSRAGTLPKKTGLRRLSILKNRFYFDEKIGGYTVTPVKSVKVEPVKKNLFKSKSHWVGFLCFVFTKISCFSSLSNWKSQSWMFASACCRFKWQRLPRFGTTQVASSNVFRRNRSFGSTDMAGLFSLSTLNR